MSYYYFLQQISVPMKGINPALTQQQNGIIIGIQLFRPTIDFKICSRLLIYICIFNYMLQPIYALHYILDKNYL